MKWLYIIIAFFLFSCSEPETSELTDFTKPEMAAVYYLNCMKDGNYDACVEEMISCDSASVEYKEKMKILIKQMVRSDDDVIQKIECTKTSVKYEGKYACAYVRLTTKSGRSETIMLPLLWNNEKWRLR